MIQDKEYGIYEEYFEWMYHLVCNDNRLKNKISYRKLLQYLNSVIFVPTIDMDDNRRIDAIDFRYRFGYENGYSNSYIDEHFNWIKDDCSVLEMMIALSFRVEEQITQDYLHGNRTGQWFWSMISSLGLNHMDDRSFDRTYCEEKIDIFLSRRYGFNGNGGLFTLEHPNRDMRNVDIWTQFMWYLNEIE